MKEFVQVLKSWKDFSGRARRREYWMFILFLVIFSIVASIIDAILGTVCLFSGILCLVAIVPSIAVAVRRMHDIGKSGYWYFINFIPVIGGLWFLYLTIQEGQAETNQYGINPKNA